MLSLLNLQVLSLFASVIAPFGGFFASGFKRGFKIKDFGNSIPGHGGMTDRMDCQVELLGSLDTMTPGNNAIFTEFQHDRVPRSLALVLFYPRNCMGGAMHIRDHAAA